MCKDFGVHVGVTQCVCRFVGMHGKLRVLCELRLGCVCVDNAKVHHNGAAHIGLEKEWGWLPF